MTLVRQVVMNAAVGVGMADTPKGLSAIHRPGCAAAIWRRQLSPVILSWINNLDINHLPQGRLILHRKTVHDSVRQLCDNADMPHGEERDFMVDDIVFLSHTFADLLNVEHLRLRLDKITTDACSKFHIDAVTARLVCTYRGTGTQYGISTDGNEPRRVFTVLTGAPFVMRGTLWPDKPMSGLLHRSPPIENTGETRLLLVLDPVANPQDAV